MLLSYKLEEFRKQCELPQRKIAATTYRKIENNNDLPCKDLVIQHAEILKVSKDELVKRWLVNKSLLFAKEKKTMLLKHLN